MGITGLSVINYFCLLIGVVVIMYGKRMRCAKCGKTLVTGVAKNVMAISCTCGNVTYPNDEKTQKDFMRSTRRNKKYEKA